MKKARAAAIFAMVPSDKDVLIGSKCLSCNRPLGGFGPPPKTPKGLDEWYTGAGGLGGPRDRVLEAGGGGGSGEAGGSGGDGRGGGAGGAGIGSSRSPGRTQPTITPAKILPLGPASSEGPGTAAKKGPQGPLLFERTGAADGATGSAGSGLKGRVLRGGGGGGGSVSSAEGNVSISKVGAEGRTDVPPVLRPLISVPCRTETPPQARRKLTPVS